MRIKVISNAIEITTDQALVSVNEKAIMVRTSDNRPLYIEFDTIEHCKDAQLALQKATLEGRMCQLHHVVYFMENG
jgi:hypothetical protein